MGNYLKFDRNGDCLMFDYKKIIKNRDIRIAILNSLFFVPDKWMVAIQYRIANGRWPNLKKPQRFTEKLLCYKLFYRDSMMKKCVDKFDVREYIESLGLTSILNECYGVYEKVDEVDFEKLPNRFVLKDTLGGGGTSVIICKDKSKANLEQYRFLMGKWIKTFTGKNFGRAWVYEGKKHRIIAEKYIESDENKGGLIDYKFFCFYGKCEYLYVIADRKVGDKAGFGIFNKSYEKLNVERCDEAPLTRNIEKPQNFEEMVYVAERISSRFPEARIDLYNVDGKILFGEITFFDGGGYMTFNPDTFDFELGAKFKLDFLS